MLCTHSNLYEHWKELILLMFKFAHFSDLALNDQVKVQMGIYLCTGVLLVCERCNTEHCKWRRVS